VRGATNAADRDLGFWRALRVESRENGTACEARAIMAQVFLLWHRRPLGDDETDEKLLGVYSSEARAAERIEAARSAPGFADFPDDFLIDPYVIDGDEWAEGFVIDPRPDQCQ